MSTIHVKTERTFQPHLLLLRAAQHHLHRAETTQGGYYYDSLAAIVFSALTIEAIGNSYGKVLIPDWKQKIAELVKSGGASPMKKLQLVAARCGIGPDFSGDPWLTIRKLTRFRDLIAHAKREPVAVESDCSESDYSLVRGKELASEVETMITTDFAKQGYDAVQQIVETLNRALNDSELHELTYGGHEFLASCNGGGPVNPTQG